VLDAVAVFALRPPGYPEPPAGRARLAATLLGPAGFEAAYQHGRELAREDLLALAAGVVMRSGPAPVHPDGERREDHEDPERPQQ
jgi:hypothetical protein